MKPPDNEAMMQMVAPIVSGIGFLAWASRKIMKTFKTDKLEDLQVAVDLAQLKRLSDEINELAADNKKLSNKIKKLWNSEMDGLPDMAALRVHVDMLAFSDCPKALGGDCPAYHAGGHIAEIIANINNRREAKRLIFADHEGEL